MIELDGTFMAWVTEWLFEPLLWPVFLGLCAAHCAAEFLTQSPVASARRAERNTGWPQHGLSVFLWIVVCCWAVMPSKQGIAVALTVTVAHLLIDATRATLFVADKSPRSGGWVFDQALHLVSLWLGAAMYSSFEGAPTRPLWLAPEEWNALFLGVALVALSANGVAAAVAELLRSFDVTPKREPLLLESPPDSPPEMGRLIGILERWLVLVFVAAGQWGAVGLVMAAKSIARFRQLEERRFSEYYLIGTLASLLAAVLLGLALTQAGAFGAALGFRVGASE